MWSHKPSTKLTSISDKLEVKLPKFSVNVVELPWTELSVEKSEISQEPISHKAAKKIKLDLLVPNRAATKEKSGVKIRTKGARVVCVCVCARTRK